MPWHSVTGHWGGNPCPAPTRSYSALSVRSLVEQATSVGAYQQPLWETKPENPVTTVGAQPESGPPGGPKEPSEACRSVAKVRSNPHASTVSPAARATERFGRHSLRDEPRFSPLVAPAAHRISARRPSWLDHASGPRSIHRAPGHGTTGADRLCRSGSTSASTREIQHHEVIPESPTSPRVLLSRPSAALVPLRAPA